MIKFDYGDYMKTIINDYVSELEINKSRFITLLYKVNSIEEVKEKLDLVKNLYKDATHYCYAYIINDNKKSSDDGEPGGTAGVPIMEVLLKNDLNFILCIVVRYFGGIKLGAGGLVRAYSKSVSNSLEEDNVTELVPGYKITFTCNYDNQKNMDYLLRDFKIEKEYLDIIKYIVYLPKDKINIIDNVDYEVIEDIFIEGK